MACVRRQFNDSNNFVGSPIEKKKKNPQPRECCTSLLKQ